MQDNLCFTRALAVAIGKDEFNLQKISENMYEGVGKIDPSRNTEPRNYQKGAGLHLQHGPSGSREWPMFQKFGEKTNGDRYA